MVTTLCAILIALFVALGVVLVHKYLRTRDVGFLLLAVAEIAWPTIVNPALSHVERSYFDLVLAGEQVTLFPFSLVSAGEITAGSLVVIFVFAHNIVQVALVLVAVLFLCRSPRGSDSESKSGA